MGKEIEKTNSKKTNNSKNNTVKKKSTSTNKEDVKNKKLSKIKTFISSYAFLYSVFGFLVILIVILGTMVFVKSRGAEKSNANLSFPLIEDGAHSAFSLDVFELSKEKDYIIKVSNFRGDTVNEKDVNYTITFKNDSTAKIVVKLDEGEDNLISDQKSTTINKKLNKDNKEYNVYHISLDKDSVIKKGDKISVEINS